MSQIEQFQIVNKKTDTDDWLTPPALIEATGPFDLDPCASTNQLWRTAAVEYKLPEQNGLLLPWSGTVWCNPPYGPEVKKWARRMALHNNGLFLVFARIETEGVRLIWKHATAILFFFNRISFCDARGMLRTNGGAPSMLAAFGEQNVERLERAKRWKNGALVRNWQ